MSRDARSPQGLIGPNAVLQFLPVLDRFFGPERRAHILAAAGILDIPDGQSMIPETVAARLHRQVRMEHPELAAMLAAHAGYETANYILANRIPRLAQSLLRVLPTGPSSRLLADAIEKNAWTFAGSGAFAAETPWSFVIVDNPIVRGEFSTKPLCAWHAAVFQRLYRVLVSADCCCEETCCAAQGDSKVCHFRITR